jgi:hypothetical protein
MYRWRNRLLLVFAANRQDAKLVRQEAMWRDQQPGIEDRDMVLMLLLSEEPGHIGGKTVSAEAAADLRRRLAVSPEGFAALLIGKDGGVKLRSAEPVAPAEIYRLIDAMPMRREEIHRKGSPGGA